MIAQLRASNRLIETLFLGFSCLLCLCLSVFRCGYTGSWRFIFLNWNLFLAFVPWVFSSLLIVYPSLQKKKIVVFMLLGSWLLFFPNAPYILTDLFHLRLKSEVPVWFDLVLILSFAWTGLLFGFMSLWDIEGILRRTYSRKLISILVVVLLFVGGFGIYLGRFLRWNSWDIVNEPTALLNDLVDRFADPFAHPRTWGVTILMGLLLNMIYWSFHLIKSRDAVAVNSVSSNSF